MNWVDKGIDRETAEQVVATVEIEDEAKVALQIAQKTGEAIQTVADAGSLNDDSTDSWRDAGFGSEIVRQILEQIF